MSIQNEMFHLMKDNKITFIITIMIAEYLKLLN